MKIVLYLLTALDSIMKALKKYYMSVNNHKPIVSLV